METSEIVKEIMEIFIKPKKNKHQIQEIIGELSKGEVGVLAYLLNVNNNISSNELEKHLQVSSARIASTLNSLEKKGLIKRSKSEEDKRKIIISITKNGSKMMYRVKSLSTCRRKATMSLPIKTSVMLCSAGRSRRSISPIISPVRFMPIDRKICCALTTLSSHISIVTTRL